MIQHVRRLLEGLAEDGHRSLSEIPMLVAEERTELLPYRGRPGFRPSVSTNGSNDARPKCRRLLR
jgi:hypothetical protein